MGMKSLRMLQINSHSTTAIPFGLNATRNTLCDHVPGKISEFSHPNYFSDYCLSDSVGDYSENQAALEAFACAAKLCDLFRDSL
jgi:hypothetical protein